MNDIVKLPRLLAARLEKASANERVSADAMARAAIVEHLQYLEWKERAIARGDADIKAGRVLSTDQVLAAVARQRARRGASRHYVLRRYVRS